MAKVVITIKDGKDGNVRVVGEFSPKIKKGGKIATGAQLAAAVAIDAIQRYARSARTGEEN